MGLRRMSSAGGARLWNGLAMSFQRTSTRHAVAVCSKVVHAKGKNTTPASRLLQDEKQGVDGLAGDLTYFVRLALTTVLRDLGDDPPNPIADSGAMALPRRACAASGVISRSRWGRVEAQATQLPIPPVGGERLGERVERLQLALRRCHDGRSGTRASSAH